MLDKYLMKGVVLNAANPPSPMPTVKNSVSYFPQLMWQLTYDGLAGNLGALDARFQQGAPSTMGFTPKMQLTASWLPFYEGLVTAAALGAYDVFTGRMSGCPIIVQSGPTGVKEVFHVGTVIGQADKTAKVKAAMQALLKPDAKGYKPSTLWTKDELSRAATLAVSGPVGPASEPASPAYINTLVTRTGKVLAIAFVQHQNRLVVLGQKQVESSPIAPMLA